MLQLDAHGSDKWASWNPVSAAVSSLLGWGSPKSFYFPGLQAQAVWSFSLIHLLKNSQSEPGCAWFEIDCIWFGILELGRFRVKSMNKKNFDLENERGAGRAVAVTHWPQLPRDSSPRQCWEWVWTTTSTAEWFPKKTADKNSTWIWTISERFQL